ncbi:MAG: inositol monophosphatase [Alphaproteobacteria bacterium]|nr:inositol monophosphatase [Alphaproteobacteria bacterium]
MPAFSANMTVMTRAAEKAARGLVRDFGEVEQLQVSRKGPGDFVSAADRRAEEVIFEELSRARPDFAFLMEESGSRGPEDAEFRWIIDPLDGTTNFLHGIPHWAISIALEQKGEIIAGIVLDPVKDELFRAEKGGGAFMRNRRLRVSGRSDPTQTLFANGDARKDRGKFFKRLDAVSTHYPFFRRMGSAALDLAYVAAGRYDGFWEDNLQPWDIAAGVLLVKEAGGFATDIGGNSNPVFSKSILATNGAFHDSLKTLLS